MDSLVRDPCGKIPDGDPGYEQIKPEMALSHPVVTGPDFACLLVGAAIDNIDGLDEPGCGKPERHADWYPYTLANKKTMNPLKTTLTCNIPECTD